MHFIGIDLHTNRFTCCYRTEHSSLANGKDKRTETFDLTGPGLAAFYRTLTEDSYVLIEATITTFCFARLFRHLVKEVIVANTYELKQISLARCNTDKIDADKLCRILKMQVLSGEQTIVPVTIPPKEIQDLRALFSTYRLMKKQTVQLKIIAIAIIADIIEVSRFRNSKAFTSYLRSAPKVAASNTSTRVRGTNKQGRKLSSTLLTQSLNHVLKAGVKLRDWYMRLSEYKKAGLVRTGLRRRVLAEIYQMLKKGEYHYGRDAVKHGAKMAACKKMLESQTVLKKSA
ncbi:MAG: transposase [Treponema sp.]|nr:transposase [Treponema sp.]